jgi:hypothetical protein
LQILLQRLPDYSVSCDLTVEVTKIAAIYRPRDSMQNSEQSFLIEVAEAFRQDNFDAAGGGFDMDADFLGERDQ